MAVAGVCGLIATGCEPSTETLPFAGPSMELSELLSAFLQPDAYPVGFGDWALLAEPGSTVTWLTEGIEWVEAEERYQRVGSVVVTRDGVPVMRLGRSLEPQAWQIRLLGPRAGVTAVQIGSGINAPELTPDLGERLAGWGFEPRVLRCDGMGAATTGARLLEVRRPAMHPAWIRHEWSCGSAGCSIGLTLYLFEPEGAELDGLPATDCGG